jgi:hypothetical protein
MPGSFPDPQSYANTALQALEEAYEDSHDSHTGSLILTAMEAIKRLKQEIKNIGKSDELAGFDPYELNEHNSAL